MSVGYGEFVDWHNGPWIVDAYLYATGVHSLDVTRSQLLKAMRARSEVVERVRERLTSPYLTEERRADLVLLLLEV